MSLLPLRILTAVLLIALSAPLQSESREEFFPSFEQTLAELMEFYDVPGLSAAVIHEGELVWSRAFGFRDLEAQQPVFPDTRFRIESITKTLTARAVLRLTEKTRISLDEPVNPHLSRWKIPDSDFGVRDVTLRNLLSHSSGITGKRNFSRPEGLRPPVEAVLRGSCGFDEAVLIEEPGEQFRYSNQGYLIVELLTEELTGMDFSAFMEQEVLQGRAVYAEDVDQDRAAVSYDLDGNPVPFYIDPFRGAGGLFMSAEQLARELLKGPWRSDHPLYQQILEPEGFYRLGADGAALGFFTEELSDSLTGVFHGGEGTGSLAMVYLVPDQQAALVLLTNSKRSWPLIYEGLSEWGQWTFGIQPAMARSFTAAAALLHGITAAILIISAVLVSAVIQGMRKNRRVFSPASLLRGRRLLVPAVPAAAAAAWEVARAVAVRNLLPVYDLRLSAALIICTAAAVIFQLFPLRGSGCGDEYHFRDAS